MMQERAPYKRENIFHKRTLKKTDHDQQWLLVKRVINCV